MKRAHLIVASIVVLAIWCIFPVLAVAFHRLIGTENYWLNTGQLGDTFGPLNALMASLSFGAVAYTVFLQIGERKQEAAERRRDDAKRRFFELLNAWLAMAPTIRHRDLSGADAVCRLENAFLGVADADGVVDTKSSTLHGPREEKGFVNGIDRMPMSIPESGYHFTRFYEQLIGAPLGHIFRLHYAIIKAIDAAVQDSSLSEHDAFQLRDIFRATLSDPDLHFMLYFGLSPLAPKDYAGLIDKYRLLEALTLKDRRRVSGRIPEIEHYPETFKDYARLRL